MSGARALAGVLAALTLAVLAPRARADEADSTRASGAAGIVPAPHDAFGRRDVAYAALAGGSLAATLATDRRFDAWIARSDSPTSRGLARAFQPLGNPAAIAPALLAVDLAGRFAHRPEIAAASERIAISVVLAGIAALALKEVVGRARPRERAGDPDDTRAFSGWESFPSGHATVAFACAAALDAETRSRWVPWVAYPAAIAVGWSRVRDREHWPSDVVAGAALGGWIAHHADVRLRRSWRSPLRLGLVPDGRGARLTARVRF